MRARGADGQVLPLVALAVIATALGLLVLARVGSLSIAQARARVAADAAALAGAAAGEQAARDAARRNGAEVVDWRHVDAVVEVTVTLGDATARSRAERATSSCARPHEGQVVHFLRCPPRSTG